MYGDISRVTHAPRKHFSRVIYQQGRVFLDADPNEQTEILLQLQRGFIRDLVGPHGGPAHALGFEISPPANDDFEIGSGRYYVDGILCEATDPPGKTLSYLTQPHRGPDPDPDEDAVPDPPFLVYLDVWERHISAVEDDAVRETALGGPDTSCRTQVVWQVKLVKDHDLTDGTHPPEAEDIRRVVEGRELAERGRLRARTRPGEPENHPCIAAPSALYRGPENQLYRVEISNVNQDGVATAFKWSRDNGSVVFPVRKLAGKVVRLASLGRDHTRTLKSDNLVEPVNDDTVLSGRPAGLRVVEAVVRDDRAVTLDSSVTEFDPDPEKHPLLRRWDGTGAVEFSTGGETLWLPLEDGIEVAFLKGKARPGDYWLIPARTATGQIEWPGGTDGEPPFGIEHHYAPLAIVTSSAVDRLRTSFQMPLTHKV